MNTDLTKILTNEVGRTGIGTRWELDERNEKLNHYLQIDQLKTS